MLIFLCFILFAVSPFLVQVQTLNQEGLYLQQVKKVLADPDGRLSNWNGRDNTPCKWTGIQCENVSQSVKSIDLSNINVAGDFPVFLCNLKNLTYLSLSNNSIGGSLKGDVISKCEGLESLVLSQNLFVGVLPEELVDIVGLKYLDLWGNNFTGEVPVKYGEFRSLEVFSVVANLLNGAVPRFLGNVSSLRQLNLSYNPFLPSLVPVEYGKLRNLEVLWMSDCNLFGKIPEEYEELKNLVNFDLALNGLEGEIPGFITGWENVMQIELYNNSLTGRIPVGMGKLSNLRNFDVSMNLLEGVIPDELCRLQLGSLNLYQNQFEGPLPASIALSPNLFELRLFGNRLNGTLPGDLGKNSPLVWFDVSENQFTGDVPAGLCEQGVLEEVLFIDNMFTGPIPEGLGKCGSLTRVRVRNNQLSGDVPKGLWSLPYLSFLDLMGNNLTGEIAKSVSQASELSALIISRNRFTGSIPEELGKLISLVEISGSDNMLTGALPSALVKLTQLGRLDLHNNKLSGVLPKGLRSWKKLNELNLANNELSGEIPAEVGSLTVLNYLDLSNNDLSGRVPMELQNLKLNRLNVSNNDLSGDLPPLYAEDNYKDSFLGNPNLCGAIAGLCQSRDKTKNRGSVWLFRSIFMVAGLVFVFGVVWFYWKYRSYKKVNKGSEKLIWTLTSFHKLGFKEDEILDCLDEDNVIGSGASGKVYKAVLSTGEVVAVKKLWGMSKKVDLDGVNALDDGFEAEVETLGKIRHKNIVRLWCSCTTRDCKLLVYEYMPNGSLGDLLNSTKSGLLDWPMRYKIAMDAAEGLSYLHHDCVPSIVHRDVKSNNILLDEEYGARVADFGVAKVIDAIGKGQKSMSVIAGSCGYIAPEYAYTLRVNEKSDIYSYGVVILELVTGRLPIDPEFGETDLVNWVCSTVDQKGVEKVIDSKLDSCYYEEIRKVLNIGLLCTNPLPVNRPSMRRVVQMLQEFSIETKAKTAKKEGKVSPYFIEDSDDQVIV